MGRTLFKSKKILLVWEFLEPKKVAQRRMAEEGEEVSLSCPCHLLLHNVGGKRRRGEGGGDTNGGKRSSCTWWVGPHIGYFPLPFSGGCDIGIGPTVQVLNVAARGITREGKGKGGRGKGGGRGKAGGGGVGWGGRLGHRRATFIVRLVCRGNRQETNQI